MMRSKIDPKPHTQWKNRRKDLKREN